MKRIAIFLIALVSLAQFASAAASSLGQPVPFNIRGYGAGGQLVIYNKPCIVTSFEYLSTTGSNGTSVGQLNFYDSTAIGATSSSWVTSSAPIPVTTTTLATYTVSHNEIPPSGWFFANGCVVEDANVNTVYARGTYVPLQ